MAKLILRQAAIDDLSEIWDYTLMTWSEKQADKYYGLIRAACNEIAMDKATGKSYNLINPGLLGYKIGKHIIFYHEVGKDEIEIIRILHERMDLKKRLRGQ